MKKMKFLAICAIALFSSTSVMAQFSTGADVVSSYVWRGIPQEGTGGTPCIQPYLSYAVSGFTIGSWASSSFTGNVKEVDLYASYAITPFLAVTLTDYYYNFGVQPNYFKYDAGETGHVFEGSLAYTGSAFSASINTMFAGADKKADGDNAYSTYAEVGYQISPIAKVFVGASLLESATYGNDGFAVTNIGLKVSKTIQITDKFGLPVYGIAGANPESGNVFFVAGLTL
jgi:hypothetical protein